MMKNIALASVLAATAVQGYIIPDRFATVDDVTFDKRQILASVTNMMGAGKVADPPGHAPKRVTLPYKGAIPGGRRVKLRYGPYKVPHTNRSASITGEKGMLWNYPDITVEKPCKECTIVGQVAGLEYPNGKNANIDTGMWLHHMVHFTLGPNRWDPTCISKPRSLPHFAIGSSPSKAERYFSSGNERTYVPLDIYGTGTDAGYHLKATDKYAFIVDLMNMNKEDVVVYMTMYYDYIEGPLPKGWRDVKTVWFDANQCGTSEVKAPQETGKFSIPSTSWVPNFEGDILGVGGHLHDGGYAVNVKYGPGKILCTSGAKYAESAEFVSPAKYHGEPGGHSHADGKHISSMGTCFKGIKSGLPVEKLSPSQVWSIDGLYDYDTHAGAKHGSSGKQDSIMSIALMYVAVKEGVLQTGGGGAPAAAKGPAKAAKAPRPAKGASKAPAQQQKASAPKKSKTSKA